MTMITQRGSKPDMSHRAGGVCSVVLVTTRSVYTVDIGQSNTQLQAGGMDDLRATIYPSISRPEMEIDKVVHYKVLGGYDGHPDAGKDLNLGRLLAFEVH